MNKRNWLIPILIVTLNALSILVLQIPIAYRNGDNKIRLDNFYYNKVYEPPNWVLILQLNPYAFYEYTAICTRCVDTRHMGIRRTETRHSILNLSKPYLLFPSFLPLFLALLVALSIVSLWIVCIFDIKPAFIN